MASLPFSNFTMAGVVTVLLPIAFDVRVQTAPDVLGVSIATSWVVPLVMLAQAVKLMAAHKIKNLFMEGIFQKSGLNLKSALQTQQKKYALIWTISLPV